MGPVRSRAGPGGVESMMRMTSLLSLMAAVAAAAGVGFYLRAPAAPARSSAESLKGGVVGDIQSVHDAAFSGHAWYLVDSRGNQIHQLDPEGKLVRSFGREGGGPGEFRGPLYVAASGNRVYVAQLTIPDVSVFDSTGTFLHMASAERPCGPSGITAMSAFAGELYLLRRCLEPPRVRYQVEHAVGDRLEVWEELADTTALGREGAMPLVIPLFAADADRVILAARESQCLTIVRRSDGAREGVRCLAEIPRRVFPNDERARMNRKFRGLVVIPDSLPRAQRAQLLGNLLLVQAVDGLESTTWRQLHLFSADSAAAQVGKPGNSYSFLSPDASAQLRVLDEVAGVRVEVTRVTH